MNRTCATCTYSHVGQGGEVFCRRHPPSIVPVIGEVGVADPKGKPIMLPDGIPMTAVQTIGFKTAFPKVQMDWTCGDHSGILRL